MPDRKGSYSRPFKFAALERMAALAAVGQWIKIYYGWRPNLPDEGDNHLIELAVAGAARAIVTHNVRDMRVGDLRWNTILILTPSECLEQMT